MRQIEILRKYGIRPQKRRGQHFLIDLNLQKKIVAAIGPKKTDLILEIGAGLGALTQGLVGSGADVVAVEKDAQVFQVLSREFSRYENLKLVNQDILRFSLKKLFEDSGSRKIKVCGNIPYYLTTPILFFLIKERAWVEFALIMVQSEVARRILAGPGGKDYGRLTLAFRYFAEVVREFDVSRQAFFPKPVVDSTVLRVAFHGKESPDFPEELLFRVIQGAFGQRRKNILNALSSSPLKIQREEWREILAQVEIDFNARAEQLGLEDFMSLTKEAVKYADVIARRPEGSTKQSLH